MDFDEFGESGWGAFGGDAEQQAVDDEGDDDGTSSFAAAGAGAAAEDASGAASMALLRELSNEDDWALDGLARGAGSSGGRRSLIDEMIAAEEAGDGVGGSGAGGATVQWGGSGGVTGIDLEEQEALLTRYFRPDQVKKLMKEQVEVDESYSELRVRVLFLCCGVSATTRGFDASCSTRQHVGVLPFLLPCA